MSARVSRLSPALAWPRPSLTRVRALCTADVVLVIGLLAVAAAARTPYLLDVPRFTDEVNEALRGLLIAMERGRFTPLTNVDPYVGPLWNYVLGLAFYLAGPNMAIPRVLVAFFGTLAVIPAYLLARGIGGRWVGGVAALMLALSPVHIAVNSHIAWSNCLTPLATTLALWLTHRAVALDRPAQLTWAGIAWGLALQTHPTAALFVPGVAAYILMARPSWTRGRWPWIAVLLALATSSPLLIGNIQTNFAGLEVGLRVQEQYAGGEALNLDTYGRRLGATLLLLSDSFGGALTETGSLRTVAEHPLGLAFWAATLLGLALAARRGTYLPVLAMVAYVVLLPLVNARFESSVPKARYVAPLLPICYTVIAMLLMEWYRRVGTGWLPARTVAILARGAVVLAGVGLLLAPLHGLRAYYQESVESGRTNALLYRTIATVNAARKAGDTIWIDRSLNLSYTLGGGQLVEHFRYAAALYRWNRKTLDLAKPPDDAPAPVGLLIVASQNIPAATAQLRMQPVDAGLPESAVRVYRVLGAQGEASGTAAPRSVVRAAADRPRSEVFVTGVPMPSALRFAPDGRLFFNQILEGKVRIASAAGVLQEEPFVTLPTTKGKEQGALGLALDPEFALNHWVYVFYCEADDENRPVRNRVVRFTEVDGLATEETPILGDLPINKTEFYNGDHNGGRTEFGPDGKLYVSVGEMALRALAPDPRAAQGKILRVNRDGSVPDDNPYPGLPAYALGFRNVWGLAFHPTSGRLVATDNGPRGYDEVNLVLPGRNYGYPTIEGGRGNRAGLVDPIWDSGEERLGMVGAAFYTGDRFPEYRGDLFFCAFNDGALHRLRLGGPDFDRVEDVETISNDCRLDVADGPDGTLYFADMFRIHRLVR